MRRFLLSLCLGLATLLPHADVIDISNAELKLLLKSGVPLVDVRTQPEWQASGVIGGSRLLTYFDESGKADPAAWLARLKPVAGPAQPLIVICRSGHRSAAVSKMLSQQAGYTTVYNVEHGMNGWLKEGGAVVPATPVIAACHADKTC